MDSRSSMLLKHKNHEKNYTKTLQNQIVKSNDNEKILKPTKAEDMYIRTKIK